MKRSNFLKVSASIATIPFVNTTFGFEKDEVAIHFLKHYYERSPSYTYIENPRNRNYTYDVCKGMFRLAMEDRKPVIQNQGDRMENFRRMLEKKNKFQPGYPCASAACEDPTSFYEIAALPRHDLTVQEFSDFFPTSEYLSDFDETTRNSLRYSYLNDRYSETFQKEDLSKAKEHITSELKSELKKFTEKGCKTIYIEPKHNSIIQLIHTDESRNQIGSICYNSYFIVGYTGAHNKPWINEYADRSGVAKREEIPKSFIERTIRNYHDDGNYGSLV